MISRIERKRITESNDHTHELTDRWLFFIAFSSASANLSILWMLMNNFNGHLNIHLHTNVIGMLPLCLCVSYCESAQPVIWWLVVNLFVFFLDEVSDRALGIWRQTIKVIFMVKNDLFGMKMISIKMFYYLLQFNCVCLLPKTRAQRKNKYHTHAKNAQHTKFFLLLFRWSQPILKRDFSSWELRHTHNENDKERKMKKKDKATQNALTLTVRCSLFGTYHRQTLPHSIDCSQWIRIPNMVKTHYGENCTHKYRIHVDIRFLLWPMDKNKRNNSMHSLLVCAIFLSHSLPFMKKTEEMLKIYCSLKSLGIIWWSFWDASISIFRHFFLSIEMKYSLDKS